MNETPSSAMPPRGGHCPGRLPLPMTRREMLKTSATGFAWLALSALTQQRAFGAPTPPHFPAKA